MKKQGLILTFIFLTALFVTSCISMDDVEERTAYTEQAELAEYLNKLVLDGNNIDTTASGVYYVKITEGTGELAKTGDTLTVGYAGYFTSGYLFDASYLHKDTVFTFVLGTTELIKGWEDGMKVLKQNSKAQFIIPSSLAYGSAGAGSIGPYQPLIFVVIMKSIKPKK